MNTNMIQDSMVPVHWVQYWWLPQLLIRITLISRLFTMVLLCRIRTPGKCNALHQIPMGKEKLIAEQ